MVAAVLEQRPISVEVALKISSAGERIEDIRHKLSRKYLIHTPSWFFMLYM